MTSSAGWAVRGIIAAAAILFGWAWAESAQAWQFGWGGPVYYTPGCSALGVVTEGCIRAGGYGYGYYGAPVYGSPYPYPSSRVIIIRERPVQQWMPYMQAPIPQVAPPQPVVLAPVRVIADCIEQPQHPSCLVPERIVPLPKPAPERPAP